MINIWTLKSANENNRKPKCGMTFGLSMGHRLNVPIQQEQTGRKQKASVCKYGRFVSESKNQNSIQSMHSREDEEKK